MSDNGIVGILLGAILATFVWGIIVQHVFKSPLKDCAKQHNVYACEIKYVPVKEIEG